MENHHRNYRHSFEHCFEQVSFSLDGRSKGFHIDEGKLIVPKQNKRRSILGIDREARFHLVDIESDWSDREFFTAYDNIGLSFDELGFSLRKFLAVLISNISWVVLAIRSVLASQLLLRPLVSQFSKSITKGIQ